MTLPEQWAARLEGRPIAAAALLPLRVFLGLTYLYAGIDKLISPHFFVDGDPFAVAAQMEGYVRFSPLAPLIEAALPVAIPIGALIALAELAIGIGLLTGLAYRLSAWSGFALSILFWLTASWSIAPYFFSPDLPYAFGFLTLALAGHGHLLVIDPWPSRGDRGKRDDDPEHDSNAAAELDSDAAAATSSTRRALLQVGVLAALTVFTAGAVSRLRAFGAAETAAARPAPTAVSSAAPTATAAPPTVGPTAAAATSAATAGATAAPATAPATAAPATAALTPGATPAPTAVAGTAGPVIASVADLGPNKGIPFTVPNEMPFALGPGGPGVLVQLPDGRFVAYNAMCPHGRCTVAYDPSVEELVCPCHLGRFDPADAAAVLGGPPPAPLQQIPVSVDGSGQIHVVLEA